MTDTDIGDVLYSEPEPETNGTPTEGFYTNEEKPQEFGGQHDEKTPKPHEKRTSTAGLVSMLWGGAGTALVQTKTDVPVGRVLAFQAPLAGVKFDELIAHTWLDSFLQPLAKQSEKIEGFGALILLPLLVGAWERRPEMATVLYPMARQVLRANLVEMAPLLKKQQADDRKAAQAMSDLSEVLGDMDLPKGADPIDVILDSIFAPPPDQPQPETSE